MRGAGTSPMPDSVTVGRNPPPSAMDPDTPAAAAKARREMADDGSTF